MIRGITIRTAQEIGNSTTAQNGHVNIHSPISVPDYTFDLIYTLVVQVDTVVKQMLSCNYTTHFR